MVRATFARVRDEIISDPLFSEDMGSYGVSVAPPGAMVRNTPPSIQSSVVVLHAHFREK